MGYSPITATELDVKEPSLLLRLTRKIIDRLSQVDSRISALEAAAQVRAGTDAAIVPLKPTAPTPPTTTSVPVIPSAELSTIRTALQATGSHPLNVGNLLGILAQSQLAGAIVVDTEADLPSAANYRPGTLAVTTTAPETLYVVESGLPQTWLELIATSTGDMTTTTAQDVTGTKTWKVQQIFDLAGLAVLIQPASAVSAGTVIFQVKNTGGTNLFSLEYNGDLIIPGFTTIDDDCTITGGLLVTRNDYGIVIKPASAPAANEALFQIQTTAGLTQMSIDEDGDIDCKAITSTTITTEGEIKAKSGYNVVVQDVFDIDVITLAGVNGGNSAYIRHGNREIYCASGSPEGVVSAGIGSLYMRDDGGAVTSFYVKESGTGNTGWVAK